MASHLAFTAIRLQQIPALPHWVLWEAFFCLFGLQISNMFDIYVLRSGRLGFDWERQRQRRDLADAVHSGSNRTNDSLHRRGPRQIKKKKNKNKILLSWPADDLTFNNIIF